MQSDEQEIRQLVATWMAATKAGELETVLSLMADDVVFLLVGRPHDWKVGIRRSSKSPSEPRTGQVRRHERDSRDQGVRRMGVYVDEAHSRG
jgi:uncharacterized protein (TIGR02246 family)